MFGRKFKAASRSRLQQAVTPPSGNSPEAIWHEFYDTQEYVDVATTSLTFFQNTNVDATRSNMESQGQLPEPQYFSIFQITLDILPKSDALFVTTGAVGVGAINDIGKLLMSGRPTWTLRIASKDYGPYSGTLLHGTGGVSGYGWGTEAAGTGVQFAQNINTAGWSYEGSLIIPPKQAFNVKMNWAAAQDLTRNYELRLGLHGILSRRVL